jgi:hypothetical protein
VGVATLALNTALYPSIVSLVGVEDGARIASSKMVWLVVVDPDSDPTTL